ncbi:MAG: hypothetical protein BRD38_04065, partial [Bacteroidetes bacterium QH_9_67_14]
MTDLTDFGMDNQPRVRKRKELKLGYRSVGHICRRVEDDAPCYLSVRNCDDHRYHGEDPWYDLPFEGDGYGLSIELFNRLHGAGVGAVYIAEEDTGTVWHFGYQQFVNGAPINFEDEADDRGWEKDPQMVVSLEDAVEKWDGHYPGVVAPQAAFG